MTNPVDPRNGGMPPPIDPSVTFAPSQAIGNTSADPDVRLALGEGDAALMALIGPTKSNLGPGVETRWGAGEKAPKHAFPSVALVEEWWQEAVGKLDQPIEKLSPWQIAIQVEIAMLADLLPGGMEYFESVLKRHIKSVMLTAKWIDSILEANSKKKVPPKLVFIGRACERAYQMACMMRIRHGYPRDRIKFIEFSRKNWKRLMGPGFASMVMEQCFPGDPRFVGSREPMNEDGIALLRKYLSQELKPEEDVPLVLIDTWSQTGDGFGFKGETFLALEELLKPLLTPERLSHYLFVSQRPSAPAWSFEPDVYTLISHMDAGKAYLLDVYGYEERADGSVHPRYIDVVATRIFINTRHPDLQSDEKLKAWVENVTNASEMFKFSPELGRERVIGYLTGSIEAQLDRALLSYFMPVCFGLAEPNFRVSPTHFHSTRNLQTATFDVLPYSVGLNSTEVALNRNLELPEEGLYSWANVSEMMTRGLDTLTYQEWLATIGAWHPHHVGLFQHVLYEYWLQIGIEKIRRGEGQVSGLGSDLKTEVPYPGLEHLRANHFAKRLWRGQLFLWSAHVIKTLIFPDGVPDRQTFYLMIEEFEMRVGEAVANAIDATSIRIERDDLHDKQDQFKIKLKAGLAHEFIRVDILDEGAGLKPKRSERRSTDKARKKIELNGTLVGGMGIGEKVINAGLRRPGIMTPPYSRQERSDGRGTHGILYLPSHRVEEWQTLREERERVVRGLGQKGSSPDYGKGGTSMRSVVFPLAFSLFHGLQDEPMELTPPAVIARPQAEAIWLDDSSDNSPQPPLTLRGGDQGRRFISGGEDQGVEFVSEPIEAKTHDAEEVQKWSAVEDRPVTSDQGQVTYADEIGGETVEGDEAPEGYGETPDHLAYRELNGYSSGVVPSVYSRFAVSPVNAAIGPSLLVRTVR